ncbi:hypothetical protein [Sulfurimonas sp.]|uniref:hypothetical protein n=1 Tax=Sulfurimonas sp. TaxID=2022749 RepID=UPI0026094F18|nr:hypothetical protein [Sulfurimonas sp.]
MAISPLGNIVLVNQMTPAATAPQNAHTNRVELQNFMAQAAVQEKDEKVLEIREAEESHALDPDREHNREESDEEMQNMSQKKKPHKKEDDSSIAPPLHKLDIKV